MAILPQVSWSLRYCLVTALFGLMLPGVLMAAPASSLTPHDIFLRDSLVADQEALLNVYRCRFDVDTEQVPGGCAFGLPVQAAAIAQSFSGIPDAEALARRDALIVEQEALLNVYRCQFDIDTELVSDGCEMEADVNDHPVEAGWHSFEGDRRHQPYLGRFWQEGAYTQAVGWEHVPAGAVPDLRVACFTADSSQEPLLKAYVAWNWFVTSRINTYELDVELPGGEAVAFDALNSTSNQASFVRYEDDIAEFIQLLISLDGEQITVSSFIPIGGYKIAATFDLIGSSTAVQSVLQECPPGDA